MGTKLSNMGKRTGAGSFAVAVVAGACLVVTLFAAGFAACASPAATRAFSSAFADFDTAPYLPEDVVDLAVATRDYTVEDCGRRAEGTEAAREAFSQLLVESAQRAAAADSPVQGRWNAQALAVLQRAQASAAASAPDAESSASAIADGGAQSDSDDGAAGSQAKSPNEVAYALANVSERYGLTQDALSHLDDCYAIIGPVIPKLIAIAVAAFALIAWLLATGRKRLAGGVLFFSPIALAAFMAVCGVWAAVDFNAFFGVFHALLFPQGNWTFPADSLLICMLPLGFWVSMGALWLAVTLLACIIAMLIGRRLRRA